MLSGSIVVALKSVSDVLALNNNLFESVISWIIILTTLVTVWPLMIRNWRNKNSE